MMPMIHHKIVLKIQYLYDQAHNSIRMRQKANENKVKSIIKTYYQDPESNLEAMK